MLRFSGAAHDYPWGLVRDCAAQFQDRTVVEAYQFRPPYPPSAFAVLFGPLSEARPHQHQKGFAFHATPAQNPGAHPLDATHHCSG